MLRFQKEDASSLHHLLYSDALFEATCDLFSKPSSIIILLRQVDTLEISKAISQRGLLNKF